MIYPEDMTPEEIAEFEREYNEFLDEERAYHDAMERDHDEAYEPEYDDWEAAAQDFEDSLEEIDPVSEYENQYELDTDYI